MVKINTGQFVVNHTRLILQFMNIQVKYIYVILLQKLVTNITN